MLSLQVLQIRLFYCLQVGTLPVVVEKACYAVWSRLFLFFACFAFCRFFWLFFGIVKFGFNLAIFLLCFLFQFIFFFLRFFLFHRCRFWKCIFQHLQSLLVLNIAVVLFLGHLFLLLFLLRFILFFLFHDFYVTFIRAIIIIPTVVANNVAIFVFH